MRRIRFEDPLGEGWISQGRVKARGGRGVRGVLGV